MRRTVSAARSNAVVSGCNNAGAVYPSAFAGGVVMAYTNATPRNFGYVSWRFRDLGDGCSCDISHSMPLVRTGTQWAHWYAMGALVRTRTHWAHRYALGAVTPGRHGEYDREVGARNPGCAPR
ncbi:hypothetical protein Bbelb_019140 [Branchiostoma belcheri]|nr:hypothetical protein Bbelb_019140 [Branchiostoma belcheri]